MGPNYVGVGGGAIATVACSPGKVAIGGGYRFTSAGDSGFNSQALSNGSGVVASFPGRMDWDTNPVESSRRFGRNMDPDRPQGAALESARAQVRKNCANAPIVGGCGR
jgi:hypothetical protein